MIFRVSNYFEKTETLHPKYIANTVVEATLLINKTVLSRFRGLYRPMDMNWILQNR